MFKLLNTALLVMVITACSTTNVPETPTQVRVVSYAQIITITEDVHSACQERLLDRETCVDLFNKINAAKSIIDSGVSVENATELLTYIRSKL